MTPEEWFASQPDLIECPIGKCRMRLAACLERQETQYKRYAPDRTGFSEEGAYTPPFSQCASLKCEHLIPEHGGHRTKEEIAALLRKMGCNFKKSRAKRKTNIVRASSAGDTMRQEYYNTREVAKRLGINTATVVNMCRRGELKHTTLPAGSKQRFLIAADELDAMLEKNTKPAKLGRPSMIK